MRWALFVATAFSAVPLFQAPALARDDQVKPQLTKERTYYTESGAGCPVKRTARFVEPHENEEAEFRPIVAVLKSNYIVNDAPYRIIVYENGLVLRSEPGFDDYRTYASCMESEQFAALRSSLDGLPLEDATPYTHCSSISHPDTYSILLRKPSGWLVTASVGTPHEGCSPRAMNQAWEVLNSLESGNEYEIQSINDRERIVGALPCLGAGAKRDFPQVFERLTVNLREQLQNKQKVSSLAELQEVHTRSAPGLAELQDVYSRFTDDLLVARVSIFVDSSRGTGAPISPSACTFALRQKAYSQHYSALHSSSAMIRGSSPDRAFDQQDLWVRVKSVTGPPVEDCLTGVEYDSTGIARTIALKRTRYSKTYMLNPEELDALRAAVAALRAEHTCEPLDTAK